MENSIPLQPNLGDINGNENSGGLARWVVYAIVAVVAAIVIAAAVVFTKKKIQESREDGSIIKDVGEALTDGVDKQVADDLLEVAIRAQTESAQLNADMETAKQLFALGQVSQADVDKAILAAEISKTTAIQKNAEAAKALESFRKKELATADAVVLEATKKATGLSQEYEKVSDGITEQKVKEANALLVELVKKRQQAEADYNDALDTKKKAEAAFLESKQAKASNKRGIITTMNKKISDLKEKIKRAKITKPTPPAPKPPAPKPPAPKPPPRPPTALELKYPYWGWNEFAGLRCKNNNNSGCTTGYDKNGQLVDVEQPPAPAPKPPPPRPPTALELKYPYWGWNEHAGLRCTNNDNTGCNTGYDAKGQLVDLNPERPPAPSPGGSVISTLDLRKLTSGGGDWNTSRVKLNKSNITQFRGDDVIYCWYDKGSGTSKASGVGGFSFNAKPKGMDRDAVAFSWDVFYPQGFDLDNGGKYGGVHVGTGVASGGRHSPDGASNRIMWQKRGGLIAYVYPPSGINQPRADLRSCDYGCAPVRFPDGVIKYDQWNTMTIGTKVNTFNGSQPNPDGELYVIMNGERKTASGIIWSRFPDKKITEFDISTFFGGTWVSPKSQFCYFKNFQMKRY